MALKNESANEDRTYIDIVVGNAQDWPTEVKPYFYDKNSGVKTSNVRGKLISARGSMTPWARGVKSITLVVIDKDWDELHINGSITMGTKDLFNQALANIGQDVSLGIYLNRNGYATWSVRWADDEFVKATLMPFDKIDLDKIWKHVEDELGYFNTESKTFVKANKEPEDAPGTEKEESPKKSSKREVVRESTDEEITVEDLPF